MSSSSSESEARVVLSTHADAQSAAALARELVGRRLAACVNVLDGVRSIYRWNGAVEEGSEALMVIKTSSQRLDALRDAWRELHPYDTPEWIVLSPSEVEPRYLEWLLGQTR